MKSALERLSINDREALAHLYEKDDYKVVCRLVEAIKAVYMEQHVGELDILQVRYLTGGIGSQNMLIDIIRKNFKEVNKKS